MSKGFCLEVTGDYACFTRPEMKVERVSYDVITPSAARAIFDAILWKPAIRWRITKIEVLNPIRWTNVRRNEVASVASPKSQGIFIEDVRQQRAGLILRDVRYRLYGEFDFIPPEKRGKTPNPYRNGWWTPQGRRTPEARCPARRNRSQVCRHVRTPGAKRPAFPSALSRLPGVRRRCPPSRSGRKPAVPIPKDENLGWMLYDLDFSDPTNVKPTFYRPQMNQGVIVVPHPESEEVRK